MLSAREILGFDSNVFKLAQGIQLPAAPSSGSDRSDRYSITSVGAQYGNAFGTQKVGALAEFIAARYDRFGQLDYNAYALGARWDADIGRALYASANLSRSRRATLLINQLAPVRNLLDQSVAGATIGLRFTPSWSVFGRVDVARGLNSAVLSRAADRHELGRELGVRYQPHPDLDAAVLWRRLDVDFLNSPLPGTALRQAITSDYTQDLTALRGRIQPTGRSSLVGEIGLVRLQWADPRQRDISDFVGGASYGYSMSGALSLGVRLRRDIANRGFGPTDPSGTLASAGSVVSAGPVGPAPVSTLVAGTPGASQALTFAGVVDERVLGLDLGWQPTAKITVTPYFEMRLRSFPSDAGSASGQAGPRQERIRNTGVTVSYELLRTLYLSVQWQRFVRTSSVAELDFAANIVLVGAELRFQ